MAVDKLVDSGQLDSDLTSVANAIRTKGGTSAQLAFPNEFVSAINAIPTGGGGGGGVEEKQINFVDYDGTILHSYTKAEINAMSSESDLPANPSHTGLTAQGWNWTLAQIKAQLTAMPDGPVWVGQMYITASGKTEIDVSMPKGRLSPIMTIAVNGTITVDWGDNTTPDTVTGTSLTTRKEVPHAYASAGDYTIVISVTSGSFTFYGSSTYLILRKNTTTSENRVYANCIQNIRLGSGITKIDVNSFSYCTSLASITIPKSITAIVANAFNYCYALKSMTFPSGISSIPDSGLGYCYSLTRVSNPGGATTLGNMAFKYCYSLKSVTIPYGAAYVSDAFGYCESLTSVDIPSGATYIASQAFRSCYSLTRMTIPASITSIGQTAFQSCCGIKEYHFLRTTPPTLSNTNAFSSIVSDCVMYVPYSADHSILNAYKTASNWSTYASRMQEEPQ